MFPGDEKYERHGVADAVTWPRCKYAIQGHRDDGSELPGQYLNGREMKEGFAENLEYFRLDFVDPAQVERGRCVRGHPPDSLDDRRARSVSANRVAARRPGIWPKHSPFAVLIQETKFNDFEEKLRERKEITHVFLVTDSEDNFALMRRELGRKYHCVQLYKSYLDNFRINTVDRYAAGKGVAMKLELKAFSDRQTARAA